MKFNLIFLLTIFILSGCTYKADPLPLKNGMITNYTSNASVHIINNQNTQNATIENNEHIPVNLSRTSEKTIELLKTEYRKRGMNINDDSKNKIKLSVNRIYGRNYFWTIGCTVYISIETNNGYMKHFKTHDNSGVSLYRACDFALTKAVASIVNDMSIRNYIENGFNNKKFLIQ